MKLGNAVLKLLDEAEQEQVVDTTAEQKAFVELLSSYGISDVEVVVEKDGTDYLVTFVDGEDEETFIFGKDENDNFYLLNLADLEDPLGEEVNSIDLTPADPAVDEFGNLDLTDLSWMNKSIVMAMFGESIQEKTKMVVRGGKKQRIVVKTIKKRMTSKQKAALAKARRKAHTGSALRKRAISNKIRKRLGL